MQYADFWQMELRPEEFNKLLNGPLSYRVAYKPANSCPCYDEHTGSPDPQCPVCSGNGYVWQEPGQQTYSEHFWRGSRSHPEQVGRGALELTGVTGDDGTPHPDARLELDGHISFGGTEPGYGAGYTVAYTALEQSRMHAQSIRSKRTWVDRGEVQEGDLECSIPSKLEDLTTDNPAWLAKPHDIFLFPDLRREYQQRMKRGWLEKLTYNYVRQVKGARSIEGGVLTSWQPEIDFEIVSGSVSWLTGGPSSQYVLDYLVSPEMYVWAEVPQMRHIGGDDLPRRVALRMFELYPFRR